MPVKRRHRDKKRRESKGNGDEYWGSGRHGNRGSEGTQETGSVGSLRIRRTRNQSGWLPPLVDETLGPHGVPTRGHSYPGGRRSRNQECRDTKILRGHLDCSRSILADRGDIPCSDRSRDPSDSPAPRGDRKPPPSHSGNTSLPPSWGTWTGRSRPLRRVFPTRRPGNSVGYDRRTTGTDRHCVGG